LKSTLRRLDDDWTFDEGEVDEIIASAWVAQKIPLNLGLNGRI